MARYGARCIKVDPSEFAQFKKQYPFIILEGKNPVYCLCKCDPDKFPEEDKVAEMVCVISKWEHDELIKYYKGDEFCICATPDQVKVLRSERLKNTNLDMILYVFAFPWESVIFALCRMLVNHGLGVHAEKYYKEGIEKLGLKIKYKILDMDHVNKVLENKY